RILQHLLDWFHTLSEVIHVQIFELGTSNDGVEINTFKQGINFNVGLSSTGQSSLGTLTSSSQTTKSTLVLTHILSVLALEFLNEVFDHAVIEILTTQVSITSSSLDFEDTFLNSQQGNIEGSSTQIENQYVLFLSFLIQTIGNGSSSWLVNDT